MSDLAALLDWVALFHQVAAGKDVGVWCGRVVVASALPSEGGSGMHYRLASLWVSVVKTLLL